MLAAALILALAIPALAAPAGPQIARSAPRDAAPRDPTQDVKGSGVIRGRITSLDTGKPLRRAQVRLTDEMSPLTPRTASTSNDGRYEFRDISPGRYTLRVQRSGYLALNYGQRRPGEQARPLEIAEQEVADKVDFALPRMSVISGRVLDDLGEPIAGVTVWVLQTRSIQGRRQLVATGTNARTDITGRYRLLSLPPGDYAVMGTTRETWPHDRDPKADGTFELKAVVGPVVLSIGTLTGDWTLKSVELNGRNLADDPIDVRHGETLNGVRVVLTNRPTQVRGGLLDEKQQPAEGTVVIFPEDTSRWREDSRTIRSARPDQHGEFSIKGLPAGKYLIAAVDYVQDGQWYDPEFLADLRPRAERLSLAEAESKRIDLTVKK
jgi:hypothetical protein